MTAYYNEIDAAAVHVLRCLIQEGVIAPGDVDTRSIKDVKPDDLRIYTQCHFFAGGGLWSVAARLAGWPDDKPLWTGSCPCQPFSQAGQGRGVADERHLWPDFHRLIAAGRPNVVVGEQVAGKAGYGWLDGVRADLGAEGYASGAVDIPAAAVDAPNIRQRLYWVALACAEREGREGQLRESGSIQSARGGRSADQSERRDEPDGHGVTLGDTIKPGLEGLSGHDGGAEGRQVAHRPVAEADGGDVEKPYLAQQGRGRHAHAGAGATNDQARANDSGSRSDGAGRRGSFWSDHEWLQCHDGKARRTKSGVRLLVNGLPGRVGLWRIAGNAINAHLAAEVLGALMDVEHLQENAA